MNDALTVALYFGLLFLCVLVVRLILMHRAAEARIDAIRLGEEKQHLRDEARRNEMLQSLLEGLGDACLIVNPDLEVAFANDEARSLFQSPVALVGRRLYEIFPDHRLTEVVERSRRDFAPIEENLQVTFNAGNEETKRHLVISAAPIRLPGAAKEKFLRVIVRDETHQRDTEQIRKDFVANASHELRTPLSIINGYLENLIEGVIDNPAMVQKSLVTMQKHSTRLARIVEDMLTISRFESVGEHDTDELRKSSFSCEECVKDVLDRLQPVIEEKQARVELDFPAEGSRMVGDRFYWDQVFFNLIENALKENQHPGLVIDVGMQRTSEGLKLWVGDSGIGIPRIDLPYIFKRFYRVSKHHGQEIKGTGLGLSIVRRAVEAHGGAISVESTPGARTQFTMLLPVQETTAPPPAAEHNEMLGETSIQAAIHSAM
ncbi:MAG: sensor histidine kinase [Verrucomicrobiales bacterium]